MIDDMIDDDAKARAGFNEWWFGGQPTPAMEKCNRWSQKKRTAYGAYLAGRLDMAAERDALAAEVARGKAPTPPRPTRIRITGPADARFVTVGGDYEVVGQGEDGSPVIEADDGYKIACAKPDGSDVSRTNPTWEPAEASAPTPPPLDAAREDLGALYARTCRMAGIPPAPAVAPTPPPLDPERVRLAVECVVAWEQHMRTAHHRGNTETSCAAYDVARGALLDYIDRADAGKGAK